MLPICPACKQSVLDEDEEDCPFCGANMKTGKPGKGKSAPASGKSSPSKPTGTKSSPTKAGANSGSGSSKKASSLDDDDDPFGSDEEEEDAFTSATKVDSKSKSVAATVSTKETKTHTGEIKCPMCDTVGFIPESAFGKDVKCANAKCTVPIFTAPKRLPPPVVVAPPKTKTKTATSSEPKSKMPLILAIVGGILAVNVIAGIYLFWPSGGVIDEKEALRRKMEQQRLAAGTPSVPVMATGTETPPDQPPATGETQPQNSPMLSAPTVAAEILDVSAIQSRMDEEARAPQIDNNRIYCRRLTSIAFAVTGKAQEMQGQFSVIERLDPNLKHFKVPALVTLGWRQLDQGDQSGATKLAEDALLMTSSIGKGSRDSQEAVIDLASLLVAVGKTKEAQTILAKNLGDTTSVPVVVMLSLARHRRDFDLNQIIPGDNLNPNRAWVPVGVSLILATHGQWDAAQKWAESETDVEARTDCLTAVADARARNNILKKAAVDPAIEALAKSLPGGGKVQLLSRLARTYAEAGIAAEADRLTKAATETLNAIAIPSSVVVSGFKEVLDYQQTNRTELRQSSIGAAGVGMALVAQKKPEEAWNQFVLALKYARGIGPGSAAVYQMQVQAEELGLQRLRATVRKLLSLRSDDEAIRRTKELQNKLDEVAISAGDRLSLQVALLESAMEAGLSKSVWRETLSLAQHQDLNIREPYFNTRLPKRLIQKFIDEGATTEVNEIESKVDVQTLPADEALDLATTIKDAVKKSAFNEAITAMNQARLAGELEMIALRSISRAASQPGQAINVWSLAAAIDIKNTKNAVTNAYVKYEALRIVAAYAASHGNPSGMHRRILPEKIAPLEKIAALLGVVEGYTGRPQSPGNDGAPAKPAKTPAT